MNNSYEKPFPNPNKNYEESLESSIARLDQLFDMYENAVEQEMVNPDSQIDDRIEEMVLKDIGKSLRDYLWGKSKPHSKSEFVRDTKDFLLSVMQNKISTSPNHQKEEYIIASNLLEVLNIYEQSNE
jgi:hypothetical protein